ncbi:unnamed protein product [Chondrus crispus]|uniref:Uncharacterized protein n=1 Tax=Chondrus crispus TaxID=2769 RepID=R7QSZ2_CHOCR|nr:unnamed protein product [Chondrus crispus]CDF40470.1 unnamed protein product [Chondrus crispus]|eukprot:XP_005710764.1 unnamed protein product [Chondrus crispus]
MLLKLDNTEEREGGGNQVGVQGTDRKCNAAVTQADEGVRL